MSSTFEYGTLSIRIYHSPPAMKLRQQRLYSGYGAGKNKQWA